MGLKQHRNDPQTWDHRSVRRIVYSPNYNKLVEALIYVADQQPRLDLVTVCWILFLSEKSHLNKFGRPITGAEYVSTHFGPIPVYLFSEFSLSLLRHESSSGLMLTGPVVTAKRSAQTKFFSRTDFECLNEWVQVESLDKWPAAVESLFSDEAVDGTPTGHIIDYADMIDSEREDRDRIIEQISETAAAVVL